MRIGTAGKKKQIVGRNQERSKECKAQERDKNREVGPREKGMAMSGR